MSALGWIGFGLAVWVVVSVVAAFLVGPVLRRNAEHDPLPEEHRTDVLDRFERWDPR